MIFLILSISIMVAWRLYDGRGYPLSEAAGWLIGPAIGALAFGLDAEWGEIIHGGTVGLLATWCIVGGYDGWDRYGPMLWRSHPAALILAFAGLDWWIGIVEPNGSIVLVAAMCVAANVTQVPLRRWQARATGVLGKYSAHICEAYEAVWIGAAIGMMGMLHA
jgi:hypothetical protein